MRLKAKKLYLFYNYEIGLEKRRISHLILVTHVIRLSSLLFVTHVHFFLIFLKFLFIYQFSFDRRYLLFFLSVLIFISSSEVEQRAISQLKPQISKMLSAIAFHLCHLFSSSKKGYFSSVHR